MLAMAVSVELLPPLLPSSYTRGPSPCVVCLFVCVCEGGGGRLLGAFHTYGAPFTFTVYSASFQLRESSQSACLPALSVSPSRTYTHTESSCMEHTLELSLMSSGDSQPGFMLFCNFPSGHFCHGFHLIMRDVLTGMGTLSYSHFIYMVVSISVCIYI